MKTLTDNQIRKLANAFACLDFSQPKAYEMFHMLEKILGDLVTNHNKTTDREYCYYKLGEQAAFAKDITIAKGE